MRHWFRVCAAALGFSLAAAGQAPEQKCRVEGTVLNSVTSQPVRKARVMLMPAKGGEPVTGATDSQGKYALVNVAAGEYVLDVSHDGYSAQRYGAKKPGEEQKGETLSLGPGSVKTKVDLQMTPLGAIFGHIRDEDGDPIRQVEVEVLQYGYGPSGKALQTRGNSQTDASGEFRIFDLPPGKYYLRAKPASSQMPGQVPEAEAYATMYYPNATQPTGAAAIQVAAGQEQRGLNLILRRIATASIRGRVVKPAGGENCVAAVEGGADGGEQNDFGFSFAGAVAVFNISGNLSGGTSEPNLKEFMVAGGTKVDKDGKFEIRNIPVGSHTLTGSCNVGKRRYRAKIEIQLEATGLENVELRPLAPSTMTGQVRVEGETKSKITETHVWLAERGIGISYGEQTPPNAPDGTVGESGEFAFHDMPPGVYHISVETPQDLYVKSVAYGGRDVRELGIDLNSGGMSIAVEVVLSANGGTIEGSVENGEGARVTLIPSDPERAPTLAKSAVVGTDGHFSFSAVAPGRYKLFAWEDADENAALYDAEFRKPFEGKSQSVDIAEKQKATVQLKVIPKTEK
jgi:uncharacterized protein (DUF2141 family)